MDTGSKVLAHADIDAMLSAQTVTQDLPKAVPISFASAPRETGPSVPAPDVLLSTVARLTERLDAVEAAVKKMGQMEQGVVETGLAIQQLRQSLQVLAQHTQAVTASIQAISANLEATPGYGLRKTFTCRSCGSKGFVAARTRCTNCGQESWVGWSPQRK